MKYLSMAVVTSCLAPSQVWSNIIILSLIFFVVSVRDSYLYLGELCQKKIPWFSILNEYIHH